MVRRASRKNLFYLYPIEVSDLNAQPKDSYTATTSWPSSWPSSFTVSYMPAVNTPTIQWQQVRPIGNTIAVPQPQQPALPVQQPAAPVPQNQGILGEFARRLNEIYGAPPKPREPR